MEGTLLPKEIHKQHHLHKLWFLGKELPIAMRRTAKLWKELTKYHQTNKLLDRWRQFPKKTDRGHFEYKSWPDVYVFADKTTNTYKLPPQDYKKLLHENIAKSYKKSPTRLTINLKAKEVAAGIKLDDRVECMVKASPYVTLKDRKDNVRSAHPCCL